jgi:uncharacterized protein (DUF924 family)
LYVKMPISPRAILDFWFKDTPPERWFIADPAFDALIRQRFEETWRSAYAGGMQSWGESMEGALALILLFDQFPQICFVAVQMLSPVIRLHARWRAQH